MADISARITSGETPAGSWLPSYSELAKRYDTSVTTIQRALRTLRQAGVVEGSQGVAVKVIRVPTAAESMPAPTLDERLSELERWRREEVDPYLSE